VAKYLNTVLLQAGCFNCFCIFQQQGGFCSGFSVHGPIAEIPLLRFVVDLLYSMLYKSTTNRNKWSFDLFVHCIIVPKRNLADPRRCTRSS